MTNSAATTRLSLAAAVLAAALVGCATNPANNGADQYARINAAHLERFGNADLPRRVGTVENIGLQIPRIDPTGRQLLYLRTDQSGINPLTLCGAAPPENAHLSIWRRDVAGDALGVCISAAYDWAHSPVWAPDGSAIAFVATTIKGTTVVHHDLRTGAQTRLGVPGQLNILPRFDRTPTALLFCTGTDPTGPFQIARQQVTERVPTILTPPGTSLLLPVMTDGQAQVLCAQPDGQHLRWVQAHAAGTNALTSTWGRAPVPNPLQTWAGISQPLAPDAASLLFFDSLRERLAVLHIPDKLVRHHRRGTIAGCWIDPTAIALATRDGVFIVHAETGASVSVFNGAWIPATFRISDHTLILYGQESPRKFAIWEVSFHPPSGSAQSAKASTCVLAHRN
jgi:hypothetical protein